MRYGYKPFYIARKWVSKFATTRDTSHELGGVMGEGWHSPIFVRETRLTTKWEEIIFVDENGNTAQERFFGRNKGMFKRDIPYKGKLSWSEGCKISVDISGQYRITLPDGEVLDKTFRQWRFAKTYIMDELRQRLSYLNFETIFPLEKRTK